MTELLLFAKFWEPGHVKTRLARVLGETLAAEACRLFVDACLARWASTGDRRSVIYWPRERREAFERVALDRGWGLRPQASGTLGDRLQAAVSEAMAEGADAVVLLGTDSPNLPKELVERAIASLELVDVVIGPAADGGYYLFATRLNRPEFFAGIEWSSPRVLGQTLERLHLLQPQPRWLLLPEWYDIDEEPDLRRLGAELRRMTPSQLRAESLQPLAAWLAQLEASAGDHAGASPGDGC